jgi:hypothetical protein
MSTSAEASESIQRIAPAARARLNDLALKYLQTRGGRAGSGLGSLLEAIWGFCVNAELLERRADYELAWFPDHAYDDFACVESDRPWNPDTKQGELFRVEAKSMFMGADESKGHFNVLVKELGVDSLLVVLLWRWEPVDLAAPNGRVSPKVVDDFVGPALPIARLRDALHRARGGTFVEAGRCPCGATPACAHIGEPLNARGSRERRQGPKEARPTGEKESQIGANFGGLLRMLGVQGDEARRELQRLRASDGVVDRYLSFIYRNFPSREASTYTATDWRRAAAALGIRSQGVGLDQLRVQIREHSGYPAVMRTL